MAFCDIMSAFVQNPKFEQRARGRRLGVELDGRVHAQRIWCDDDIEPGLFNSKIKTRGVGGWWVGVICQATKTLFFHQIFEAKTRSTSKKTLKTTYPENLLSYDGEILENSVP